MRDLPHILARLFDSPLLYHRQKCAQVIDAIGPRLLRLHPDMDTEASQAGHDASAAHGLNPPRRRSQVGSVSGDRPYAMTADGIAVIEVLGTLVSRTHGIDFLSGRTSYRRIEQLVLEAAGDSAVRAILLDIDSPGGESGGAFDLSDTIYGLRGEKPIWAMANEDAFSAAYAIARAADRLWVTRTGGVGSVGVIAVHLDQSSFDEGMGLKYTAVFAGDRKNDFDPHSPLTAAAEAVLRKEVDRLYALFVDRIAAYSPSLDANAVRATEAGLFFGPDAVAAGLADEVGTPREASAALAEAVSASRFYPGAAPAALSHGSEEIAMKTNAKGAGTTPAPDTGADTDTATEETEGAAPETPEADAADPPAGDKAGDDKAGPGKAGDTPAGEEQPAAAAQAARGNGGGDNVVTLDSARSAAANDAAWISEMCTVAGKPEMAADLIRAQANPQQVREKLNAARTETAARGEDVDSTQRSTPASLNPRSVYARRREAANKTG